MMAQMDPGAPLVSLSEAQAYCRIETGDEEALLAGLVRTASSLCEAFAGQVILARPFVETLESGPGWTALKILPVRSIGLVEAVSSDGQAVALPPSAVGIDIGADGRGWVRVADASAGRIRVHGSAGLAANPNHVPEPLRQGVLRLVAHLFQHRDGEGGEPPAAVTALWRPYRHMGLIR